MNLIICKKIKLQCLSIFLIGLPILSFAFIGDTRLYELEHANDRLNMIYKKIRKHLIPADQVKLKMAQREWIKFRDLDCTWAFSGVPLDCMIDRTENRVKELEATDFFNSKGEYHSIGYYSKESMESKSNGAK